MAYCRFNSTDRFGNPDSDVYVVRTDVLFCYCGKGKSFMAHNEQDMIVHLQEHRMEGKRVPQRVIDRLQEEYDAWHV